MTQEIRAKEKYLLIIKEEEEKYRQFLMEKIVDEIQDNLNTQKIVELMEELSYIKEVLKQQPNFYNNLIFDNRLSELEEKVEQHNEYLTKIKTVAGILVFGLGMIVPFLFTII